MAEGFIILYAEIPLNVNSKRLEQAISIYKGEKPASKSASSRASSRAQSNPSALKRAKRARSAYSFFVNSKAKNWKQDNPEQSFADFSRSCAAEWKGLEDKSEFFKLAELDRKRRDIEREDEEEDEEDKEEEDIEEEDGEKVEAADERPVSKGPPFSRSALEKEKLPKLRLLCFK